MFSRINLFVSALALVIASGASAYDHGTKATAMQNIEDRPTPVSGSSGPAVRHYDKAGVASLNRDEDARRFESWHGVESSHVEFAESSEIRTQRSPAARVAYSRSVENHMTFESAPAQPKGRDSSHKATYYATRGE